MKKLLAVDGNSILNRAFYGVRMLNTRDGLCTNAVYGMITILTRHLEMSAPDGCAIAFDRKAPTFRHLRYDGYKANRHAMPEELAMQLPYAHEAARLLGFHVLEMDGYEADDILGTLAEMSSGAGNAIDILTGDRDALQLIDSAHDVRVLLATNQDTVVYDEAAFVDKYGVRPGQFVDVKALMGDSSDNIPGVAGIGEKTALKLIAEFGSLDALYAAYETAKLSPSVKDKLTRGRESALLSRELAQICRTAPVGVVMEELAYHGPDREGCRALFEKLEFHALLKRFALEGGASTDGRQPLPLVDADASALLALAQQTPVAISFDAREEAVLACADGGLWRVPADAALAPLFADAERKLICYDYKSLRRALGERGLDFAYAAHDVMLAAYVLNSADSYGLPRLVNQYLGETVNEAIPAVQYVAALYPVLDARLREQGEAALMYDIEMPTARVLADMETIGFRIDRAGLQAFGDALRQCEEQYAEQIYAQAGEKFNINSPKQLGEVLFERLGLPAGKKTKTGYSTNAEVLERLRPFHPIVDAILDYRQVAKLRSTYADGLLRVADEAGRVHTSFNQTGTATGRLSSNEPNLQNIPIRTALGREMRRFFVAEEGYVLLDADYSQIELRLLADISGDATMIAAFASGEDIHTSTACTVFGVRPEEVTLELRKRAKAVNFGIVYGIGDFSLAGDLGISRMQAKQYIENYLAGYPQVDAYLKNIIKTAYEQGYVTTVFGRRRYIPELSGQNKNLRAFGERVAMNSPIQGSAADIIKIAMVRVDTRLREMGLDARLILQVHDELIVEAHRDCTDRAMAVLLEEMEHAVSLKVPLDVDAKEGETWFACK